MEQMLLNSVFGVVIGLTLGLFGAGGAILIVPYLVYVLTFLPKVAITSSLLVVGASTIFGVISRLQKGQIMWNVAAMYCPWAVLFTLMGAYLGKISSGTAQLIVFAVLMIPAAYSMWHGIKLKWHPSPIAVGIGGCLVGTISGFVGIGGGFLAVPLLSTLQGVSAQQAVAVSMVSIVLQSFTGLVGYREFLLDPKFPFGVLAVFIAASATGNIIGSRMSSIVPEKKLKKGFAAFICFTGIWMLARIVIIR